MTGIFKTYNLFEFKSPEIKNQLISTEEMEVLLKMLNQANEQEKVKIKELLQSHPFSQEVKKEGKLEGKLEEKRKIAVKLLHLKMDVDTIAKVTGLTQTQIEELKKQMLDGKPCSENLKDLTGLPDSPKWGQTPAAKVKLKTSPASAVAGVYYIASDKLHYVNGCETLNLNLINEMI